MTELSPIFGLTIPEADGSDDADLATLLRSLGLDVENKAGGITAMTSVQRTALTGTGKYAGRTVYQTDDGTLWRSNGTDWRQVVLLDASGHLPMGGKKITGLAAGTANGDAVARQQVQFGVTTALSAGESAALSFSPAFGSTPAVVAAPMTNLGTQGRWAVGSVSTTGATVTHLNSEPLNVAFMWIAVGNCPPPPPGSPRCACPPVTRSGGAFVRLSPPRRRRPATGAATGARAAKTPGT